MNAAIIDIGSGSVGLSLAILEKGKIPVLKYSKRKELAIQNPPNPQILFRRTLDELGHVIAKMQRDKVPAPSKIFCFLSPHLIASQTRKINLNFKEPIKINESIINSAIEKELQKFMADHARRTEVLVERKVIGIKLNGYQTANFNNRVAGEIEISAFFTLASSSILDRIKKLIAGFFHNENIEFNSFPSAYFTILRDIFKSDEDFVFIDIGSEITDVSVVREGILERSVSFPSGKNKVIRSLMDKMRCEEAIARSVIRNYTEEIVANKTEGDFWMDMAPINKEWATSLRSALINSVDRRKLPNKIFILSDQDVSGIFKKFIASADLGDIFELGREPEVRELSSVDLSKFCDNKSGSADDPFIMVPAIFIGKLWSQTVDSGII